MSQRFHNMPKRMRQLPVDHRGFPVPWFVPFINGEPVFPAQRHGAAEEAWKKDKCWVCGQKLGPLAAFVIGPMCAINRVSAEPPSHLECARFSARSCPFLSRPNMRRSMDPSEGDSPAGVMVERNPGVTLLWIVQTKKKGNRFQTQGGSLFEIGPHCNLEWYREGRAATRAEVLHSIETGLPVFETMVEQDVDPVAARKELDLRTTAAMELLPMEENLP